LTQNVATKIINEGAKEIQKIVYNFFTPFYVPTMFDFNMEISNNQIICTNTCGSNYYTADENIINRFNIFYKGFGLIFCQQDEFQRELDYLLYNFKEEMFSSTIQEKVKNTRDHNFMNMDYEEDKKIATSLCKGGQNIFNLIYENILGQAKA